MLVQLDSLNLTCLGKMLNLWCEVGYDLLLLLVMLGHVLILIFHSLMSLSSCFLQLEVSVLVEGSIQNYTSDMSLKYWKLKISSFRAKETYFLTISICVCVLWSSCLKELKKVLKSEKYLIFCQNFSGTFSICPVAMQLNPLPVKSVINFWVVSEIRHLLTHTSNIYWHFWYIANMSPTFPTKLFP